MSAAPIAVTDGGLETVMVFKEGLDLPHFAAFPLLKSDRGREALRRYFGSFLAVADDADRPFVLDTPTWRANRDWGAALGLSAAELAKANADAVHFVRHLVGERPGVTIEGVVGPRADGYVVAERMNAAEAAEYHSDQIGTFREEGVGRVAAVTFNYVDEATGFVLAASDLGVAAVVSFTVETDGRLPDGTALGGAIAAVDAATDRAADFFMVNCAHPIHVLRGLGDPVTANRVRGLRVNASALSHAELDEAEFLDEGDPRALATDHAALKDLLPNVEVLGGCCGTDSRHVKEIVAAW